MKTKTTLAALLLAAVMVTPSYGADEFFLKGAEDYLKKKYGPDRAFFCGYIASVADNYVINLPDNVDYPQLYRVIAHYVYDHPAEQHEIRTELIKRACKEAWPEENAHVQTTKRVKRKLFGGGNADAVARDGN